MKANVLRLGDGYRKPLDSGSFISLSQCVESPTGVKPGDGLPAGINQVEVLDAGGKESGEKQGDKGGEIRD